MPVIWIPALLRDLTDNQVSVSVTGETVRQVIDQLDARFPGIKERLVDDGALRPGIAVFVDGELCGRRLGIRLSDHSEVHFLPSISGGVR